MTDPNPEQPGWSPWAPRTPGASSGPSASHTPAPRGHAPRPSQPSSTPPAPWAPSSWQGGPSTGSGGTGRWSAAMPPSPPSSYPPLPVAGPGTPPQVQTVPDHRSSKFGAAVMGAVVGGVVAALVAGAMLLGSDGSGGGQTARAQRPTGPNLTVADGGLDIQGLLARAEPSVVTINSASMTTGGTGTGFVISSDGFIVTNAHVLAGGTNFQVVFSDGRRFDAKLVGTFPENDIGMVKIEPEESLVPATLGSSEELRVGDDVVAIGNALNLGTAPSVTRGIVSAKDRTIDAREQGVYLTDLIQTDAAINPGNSGGPLINARGEVVGINTAIIPNSQSVGFSISIDSVKPLIEQLKAGDGEVNADQAFLGVSTIAVDSPDLNASVLEEYGVTTARGAFVSQVQEDSPAQRAGIAVGDVIVAVDDEAVADSETVGRIVREHEPGDEVVITVERQGEPIELPVTLGKRG